MASRYLQNCRLLSKKDTAEIIAEQRRREEAMRQRHLKKQEELKKNVATVSNNIEYSAETKLQLQAADADDAEVREHLRQAEEYRVHFSQSNTRPQQTSKKGMSPKISS
jgi:phage-related minor tail protein